MEVPVLCEGQLSKSPLCSKLQIMYLFKSHILGSQRLANTMEWTNTPAFIGHCKFILPYYFCPSCYMYFSASSAMLYKILKVIQQFSFLLKGTECVGGSLVSLFLQLLIYFSHPFFPTSPQLLLICLRDQRGNSVWKLQGFGTKTGRAN